jgi:hypothetical protein
MLKKLLKYDLRTNFKFLAIFYVLALIFAILTRICFTNNETLAVQILGQIFNGTTIAMIVNILINNLMRLWVFFKRNLYGDEGYLMQTLPVKRACLFSAKYLTGLLTMTVSFLVIIAVLAIAYLTPESYEGLKIALSGMAEMMDSTAVVMILAICGLIFLEFLAILLAGFLGIIVGHQRLTNRTAWSVLFGFAFYLAMQQIVGIGIVILAIVNPEARETLFTKNTIPELNVLKPMILIAIIAYSIDLAAGYFIGQKIFKKIDLD